MRRWQSYFEILYFPLILLFVACFARGLSGIILNTTFQTMFRITNKYIILFAEMFNYLGYFFIQFFPFLCLIKLLSKRFDDQSPIVIGIVSYVVLHVTTIFFASNTLPSTFYSSILGISLDASNLSIAGNGIRLPLATGFVSVIISYNLARYFYEVSRRKSNVGMLAFINKDASALIQCVLASILAGIAISFAWYYLYKVLYKIFDFIASDITNPVNLFIYGIMEKLLAILDLDNIIHNAFWFGEKGGSWVNNNISYLGDINVWTAQIKAGVYKTGFGRFITPFYVQNIFIIPTIIGVTYSTFTDKIEKNKYLIFLVLSLLASIVCGNTLPFEIYMLLMTPLFYFFHVFSTGVLYAILQASKIWIGYSYVGSLSYATPGTLFELLVRLREGSLYVTGFQLALVGVVFAIIYGVSLYYYYYYGSIDILQTGKDEKLINSFITSVGGLENIKAIWSTPTKIILQVDDASLLNFKIMQEDGAYKVVETRTTYDISYGAKSCLMVKKVNEKRKKRSVQITKNEQETIKQDLD